MSITIDTHAIVTNEAGEIITQEDGNILMQELATKNIISIRLDAEIAEQFGIELNPEFDINDNVKSQNTDKKENSTASKTYWTRDAILMLIGFWSDHQKQFASTSIRNDIVWRDICEKMSANGHTFSIAQCKDKFKYLKSNYTKKIDNMDKNKNSGAEAFNFAYFNEMDQLFGKKPNINPEYIASSSRPMSIPKKNDDKPTLKGQKRKINNEELSREIEENRCVDRERRHKEKMEIQREALKIFKESFDKLMEKLD